MLLKNARYYDAEFQLTQGDIVCEGERIVSLGTARAKDPQTYDMSGMLVLPGLIDMHIHGSVGVQVDDAKPESIRKIAKYLAREGVTSFAPTTISNTFDNMAAQCKAVAEAHAGMPSGARILGIHLEGPYFSEARKGAHKQEYLRDPSYEEVCRLDDLSGGLVKLIDLAPERGGSMEFIARAKEKFRVGLAHSDCDYDTAVRAFRNGASHVIHLFNGMSSLSHREPGLPGAVFDSDCLPTAEIIGDGLHVHPAVIRMAAKLLGKDRLVLISDAIVAAGLPDGRYVSGDMPIIVKEGQARIEAGNLAGSSITVMEGLRRALRFGVDRETALRAVTINPARVLGVDKDLGTIEVGKLADFTVVNSQLEVQRVMIGGKPFNRGLT